MNASADTALFSSLLERHEKQGLPRMLDIKKRVDAGERLYDTEIDFMRLVFRNIAQFEPLIERHPEYQTLFSRLVDLYREISTRALANEK